MHVHWSDVATLDFRFFFFFIPNRIFLLLKTLTNLQRTSHFGLNQQVELQRTSHLSFGTFFFTIVVEFFFFMQRKAINFEELIEKSNFITIVLLSNSVYTIVLTSIFEVYFHTPFWVENLALLFHNLFRATTIVYIYNIQK